MGHFEYSRVGMFIEYLNGLGVVWVKLKILGLVLGLVEKFF